MSEQGARQKALAQFLNALPPIPQVVTRALALLHEPDAKRAQVAEVIALDPALAGHFLRAVNSAYYGLPRRVTSLDEAIGFLGFAAVEEMLLALSTVRLLSREVPAYLLEREALWLHSVAVAEGARQVAQRRGIGPLSEAYVAGLLHDVGKLAAEALLAHASNWGQGNASEDQPFTALEKELLGMDHAELSAVIVRTWNLPDRVIEAVAYHHRPSAAVLDLPFAAALHIADAAALMAGIGLGLDGMRYPLDERALGLLDWQEEQMEALVGAMTTAVERAKAILAAAA